MSSDNLPLRLRQGWPAAGKALRQLSLLGCAFTLLWVCNVLDKPSALFAQVTSRSGNESRARATRLMHQQAINSITTMIGQSIEVLAVHNRQSTPYTEIVLWRNDRQNPGVIDPDELVVISHSRLFRTVSVYEALSDQ